MVVDDNQVNIVPDGNDPLQVESEWYLLQACPGEAANADVFGGNEAGAGNEAVSRRFEFYAYSGAYDPDPEAIHQAMCDNPVELSQQTPDRCGDPNPDGVAGVGGYLGKQNVAINLAGIFAQPNQPPVAHDDIQSTDEDVPVTFSATANDTDADGTINNGTVDLNPDSAGQQVTRSTLHGEWSVDTAGNITFTPAANFNGTATGSYTVEDNDSHISNTASVTITVNPVNDAPVANAGADQSAATVRGVVTLQGEGTDVDGDPLTYSWTLTSKPAHSKAVFTDNTAINPTFETDKEGDYIAELTVNDGILTSVADSVTVTAVKPKKK
jgi:hypothetical protein